MDVDSEAVLMNLSHKARPRQWRRGGRASEAPDTHPRLSWWWLIVPLAIGAGMIAGTMWELWRKGY
jgi:hypothetical protein